MQSRIRASTFDISQGPILNKLTHYVNLVKKQGGARVYDDALTDKLTEHMKKGHCSGFAAVGGYSLWLQFQPQRTDNAGNPIPRDDWEWYQSTLESIAAWDGLSLPRSETSQNIERLLSLIHYFQFIYNYLPIDQNEIQKSMDDTRERKPVKEYSLAGLLTLHDLTAILPRIVHEDHLVFINSHNHTTHLFLHGSIYYFYNPNYKSGINKSNDLQQVATSIFHAMAFKDTTPSPLGFQVFSFEEKPCASYPLHSDILSHLPLHSSVDGYADNATALYIAAYNGCIDSLKIYLRNAQPTYVNQAALDGTTPLFMAAQNGHIKVIRLLVAQRADVNQPNHNGLTPAGTAAMHNLSTVAIKPELSH